MVDDTLHLSTFVDGKCVGGAGKSISQVLLAIRILEQKVLPRGIIGVHTQALYAGETNVAVRR